MLLVHTDICMRAHICMRADAFGFAGLEQDGVLHARLRPGVKTEGGQANTGSAIDDSDENKRASAPLCAVVPPLLFSWDENVAKKEEEAGGAQVSICVLVCP